MKGRHEAAEQVLIRLHKDKSDSSNSYAKNEYLIMKTQLDMEAETQWSLVQAFKSPSLRKRFILGWWAMSGTQFTGLLVILSISISCSETMQLTDKRDSLPTSHLR